MEEGREGGYIERGKKRGRDEEREEERGRGSAGGGYFFVFQPPKFLK